MFSAQEGDHLSRTTAILTGFRPLLSYQPAVNLPTMRYVQVDVESLAGIDAAGPSHGSDAFRDAVGEGGRIQMREMYQSSVTSSMTYVFKMRPSMSTVGKEWLAADPTFWTVKAPEPVAAVAARKK